MDLLKAKIFLDKLNREFNRLSKDPDNIARIDVDIMLSYARDFYDALLSERVAPSTPHWTPTPAPPAPVPAPVRPPVVEPALSLPPAPEPIAPPAPKVAPDPDPKPQSKPEPAASSGKAAKPEPAAPAAGFEALFEEKQVKEMADKLSELPIADLKKGIALNDRLLLTRELFADDAKAFDQAIHTLNQMDNFDQAKAYLIEHCAMRYAWPDKKRIETAKNFIKLVRRRFKTS
ncbi:MAG: hypothetical protein ACK4NS_05420 [Saprospiraceae bacterium]